jgi:hypothetical protein
MNMALDEIGKGWEERSWEKATFRAPPSPILVAYLEPKRGFLDFLAGNSPVQPLTMATLVQQGQQCQHNKGGNASTMRAMMPAQEGDNASTIPVVCLAGCAVVSVFCSGRK